MKVNPTFRATVKEIAEESIKYANDRDTQYKYIRRFLHLYDNGLTLNERIYVIAAVFEMIHYRNIVTDQDTMLNIADIKLRTFMGMTVMVVITLVIAAILFKTNADLNNLVSMVLEFTKILSI